MKAFARRIHAFLVNEDGPTATEYAVMLALIIVVAIGAIQLVGQDVQTTFQNVDNAIP